METPTKLLAPVFVLLASVSASPSTYAEVLAAANNGFQVRSEVTVAQPAAKVYRAFVQDIGRWWDKSHTYSGNAANLFIKPSAGGFLGERLPDGGFVRHLDLVYLAPNKAIRFTGGLGPLQELGVHGSLSISFTPHSDNPDSKTKVTLQYNVSGFAPEGLSNLATPVDRVLQEQLDRLRGYCEK